MDYEVGATDDFRAWMREQPPDVRRTVTTRVFRFRSGLFGDVKSVGDGISEARIHAGPGYRVYYTIRGRVIVVLLCGGTKRTQARDIMKAKGLMSNLQFEKWR